MLKISRRRYSDSILKLISGLYWFFSEIATSKSVMIFAEFGCPDEDQAFPTVVSVKTLGGDVLVDLTGKRLDVKTMEATGLHKQIVIIS